MEFLRLLWPAQSVCPRTSRCPERSYCDTRAVELGNTHRRHARRRRDNTPQTPKLAKTSSRLISPFRKLVSDALAEKLRVQASKDKLWLESFGKLRTLRKESARINRIVEQEFGHTPIHHT